MLVRYFNSFYEYIISNRWTNIIFISILVLYPIVFLTLYYIYGLKTIGIHTNLIIPIYIITISKLLINKNIKSNIFEKIKHITSIYFIIELFLIIISPHQIDNNIGLQYNSKTKKSLQTYYHLRKPNKNYKLKQSEFNYARRTNSLGFSDIEISKVKDEGNIRIICIGDSFTEGDGTHKDSTYVKFLEKIVHKKYSNIEFINAGRCGSDPFYDFELMKDILIDYQPDIVLQTFTTNDFYHDFIMKGGQERFLPNYNVNYKNSHWWEPIYATSYIARILIQTLGDYDKYLVKTIDRPAIEKEMIQKSKQLFEEYQKYLSKSNTDLILFTLPFKQDLNFKSQNDIFYKIFESDFQQKKIDFYNLEACYKTYISQSNTQVQDFYWAKDGHHNAKGYEMMAHCIEEILTPIIEEKLIDKKTLLN